MNIRKIKIAGIIMAAAGTAVLAGCAAGKDSEILMEVYL